MKKLYFLAAGLFAFLASNAQYDLTDANTTPSAGDTYTLYKIEGGTSPGGSGADVAWDFSGLSTGTEITATWEAVSTGSPDIFYSNPAVGVPDIRLAYDSTFAFYLTSSTGLKTVGYANNYGGLVGIYQIFPYNVVVDYFDYPFQYQDANTTTVDYSYTTLNGAFPVSGDVSGPVKIEYDAYGNITLPDGKYVSDVARIKITETLNRGPGGSIDSIRNTFYEYREAFTPTWIGRVEETRIIQTSGDKLIHKNAYFVKGSQVQNVSELIANSEEFVVYPNPTADMANVSFELNSRAKVQISIVDILGNGVHFQEFENLSAGKYNENIDVSGLVKGYYLIKININGKIQAQKIQKL